MVDSTNTVPTPIIVNTAMRKIRLSYVQNEFLRQCLLRRALRPEGEKLIISHFAFDEEAKWTGSIRVADRESASGIFGRTRNKFKLKKKNRSHAARFQHSYVVYGGTIVFTCTCRSAAVGGAHESNKSLSPLAAFRKLKNYALKTTKQYLLVKFARWLGA